MVFVIDSEFRCKYPTFCQNAKIPKVGDFCMNCSLFVGLSYHGSPTMVSVADAAMRQPYNLGIME